MNPDPGTTAITDGGLSAAPNMAPSTSIYIVAETCNITTNQVCLKGLHCTCTRTTQECRASGMTLPNTTLQVQACLPVTLIQNNYFVIKSPFSLFCI